jgi:plastocyanin
MRPLPIRRRAIVASIIALAMLAALTAQAALGQGSTLRLRAAESGGLHFDKSRLSARSGRVTIAMSNSRSNRFPHGIAVEGNGVDKDGKIVRPGGTSRLSLTLKKGRYAFYCPVDSHRQMGMRGTLVVR